MSQPKNARRRSGRVYVWPPAPPHELELPSVTRVIGEGLPKPALKYWAQRKVAEYAYDRRSALDHMDRDEAVGFLKSAPYKTSNAKADVGTEVHDYAEALAHGTPPPDVSPEARPYCRGVDRFFLDFEPEFVYAEESVYNPEHNYAGTMDGFATFALKPELGLRVMDYKTSKGVYDSHVLQLAALARGEFVGVKRGEEWVQEPVPEVVGGLGVQIGRYDYKVTETDTGDEVFESFLAVARVAAFRDGWEALYVHDEHHPEGPSILAIGSPSVKTTVEWMVEVGGPVTLAQVAEGLEITERAARGRLKRAYRDYAVVEYDEDAQAFSVVPDVLSA